MNNLRYFSKQLLSYFIQLARDIQYSILTIYEFFFEKNDQSNVEFGPQNYSF